MKEVQQEDIETNKQGVIEIDGFRLGYRIEGEGFPALVVGSSVYYPRTFRGAIRQHLQLIFIDHRGFVPSPPDAPNGDVPSLDRLLDDMEAMRKALGLSRFILIGHSGHAFLALEYAKKYPQPVSHVVLIGASPDFSEAAQRARAHYFQREATPARKLLFREAMAQLPAQIAAAPEKRFVTYCLCSAAQGWYNYQFDATPLWEGVYTNMPVIDHVWGVVFRDIDLKAGLDRLDKPVFLALGQYDYLTGTPFLWDGWLPLFKDLTLKLFRESAHTLQFEEADLFNQELVKWLGATATPFRSSRAGQVRLATSYYLVTNFVN